MPYLFISISILLWMLYPPLSNEILKDLSVNQAVFFTHGTAALFITLIGILFLRKELMFFIKEMKLSFLTYIIISGFLIFTSHVFLFKALSISDKYDILTIIIFESWPIFTFILNNKIRLKYKSSLTEYFLIFLCFLAFIILMIPNLKSIESINDTFLLVSIFAITSSLSMALNCLSRIIIFDKMSKINTIKIKDIKIGIITELFVRVIAAIFFALFMIYNNEIINITEIKTSNILLIAFIGFFILIIGSILYDLAIYKSKNSNLIILWYLIPIGSITYFVIFNQIYPSPIEIISCFIIIGSNILLNNYKKIYQRLKIQT